MIVFEQPLQSPISELTDPLFDEHGVSVQLLRLDLSDPLLNGNKPFKLFPNIELARSLGHQTLLSFGGAWSNHIHALAEAGQRFGFSTIGVIRGDDDERTTQTLNFARSCGMTLLPVSRRDYRRRLTAEFIDRLRGMFGDFYLIPEGGANQAGVTGCKMLASVIQRSLNGSAIDEIVLACGTGTTLAGLTAGLSEINRVKAPHVRGIAVLKGAGFLRVEIKSWLDLISPKYLADCWTLETEYHCGGYARFPVYLSQFVHEFEARNAIPLDPVYTAKALFAVYERVRQGLYRRGSAILVIHTGGLQGRQQP
jgi:1-aminocyclopropane-1-carboxylate deaminase